MGLFRQFACVVRGGHRWQTLTDTEGSVTYCVRCDKTSHVGTDFDPPADPRAHAHAGKVSEVQRTTGFPP
jgi:hypothetical protein